MTVLSLQWLSVRPRHRAARPRHRAALPRHLRVARRPARPQRPAYYDPFFADPSAVEDDGRRLRSPRPV
jgi:hypothetical protein